MVAVQYRDWRRRGSALAFGSPVPSCSRGEPLHDPHEAGPPGWDPQFSLVPNRLDRIDEHMLAHTMVPRTLTPAAAVVHGHTERGRSFIQK
jgi:hypothetical protein